MSSPLLFDEDKQMKSLKTCLDCTPLKLDREQTHLHSNPESTFHYIKNIPQSSCPSCATSISRPGRCRPLFTIIPSMPQDSAKTVDVRSQLVLLFMFVVSLYLKFRCKPLSII